MRQYINWKTYLILVAGIIIAASLYYTNQLARRLQSEEKKKVELLVKAIERQIHSNSEQDLSFMGEFVSSNTTIPLIITDGQDRIQRYINIDTPRNNNSKSFLNEKLEEFRSKHAPIVSDFGFGKANVYYGESYLLTQLRYFPYIQFAIIVLFLIVVLIALSSAHRSLQNQVWVGLSKETAHQLGTPLSSMEAWMELLQEHEVNAEAVTELRKDIDRLKLVADRFSKVGSVPQLELENLVPRLENMVDYMQKRAPKKVSITLQTNEPEVPVVMSGPLLDWVIENLIRNALDAMAGTGRIEIKLTNTPTNVYIDVCDNGKGIPKHLVKKIFNPGFTTKKRGWGLGLSLSKRIIDKYHHGSLFVKTTEVGKGTTFRIILRR